MVNDDLSRELSLKEKKQKFHLFLTTQKLLKINLTFLSILIFLTIFYRTEKRIV